MVINYLHKCSHFELPAERAWFNTKMPAAGSKPPSDPNGRWEQGVG